MTDSTAADERGIPALSRRQALAVGGGLAAAGAVLGGGTAAAAEAGAVGGRAQVLHSVSLSQAKAILRAAEREAVRIGVLAFIYVIDVGGDLKAASRQDGNSGASPVLAPIKAKTALAFRTSTATLAERTTDPIRAQSFLAAGFTLLGGGVPIVQGEQVIGAVGVGGGSPEQDAQIAQAGVDSLSRPG